MTSGYPRQGLFGLYGRARSAWLAILGLALVTIWTPVPAQAGEGLDTRSGLRLKLTELSEFQPAPDPKDLLPGVPENLILVLGQAAPRNGVLVTSDWMQWHLELELQRDKLKAQVVTVVALAATLQTECLKGLDRTVEAAEPRWYESLTLNRWVWFGLGFVAAVAVVVVGIYALDAIK